MQEIEIGGVAVTISSAGENVRVTTSRENIILTEQTIDNVTTLIRFNFDLVVRHYQNIVENANQIVALVDINILSLSIVFYYLYMYNSWRVMYRKQENRDLKFNEKDFSTASTHDLVFQYFKTCFSNNWREQSAVLLEMNLNEVDKYYKSREAFYNK